MLSAAKCHAAIQNSLWSALPRPDICFCLYGCILIIHAATAALELQNSERTETAADAATSASELHTGGPCCFQNGLQHVVCTTGDMERKKTACAVLRAAKTGDIIKREHWPNLGMYEVTVAGTTSSRCDPAMSHIPRIGSKTRGRLF